MAEILRGDIVWANLDPAQGHEQGGDRPVVVLSQDGFNARSGTVIILPLTSQQPRAGFPLWMELRSVRLPKRSWAKISQIRTISVKRLRAHLGRLEPQELAQLIDGLNELVGD